MTDSPGAVENLITAYLNAKQSVIELGYGHEIDWMASLEFENVDERTFLREAAWVVLSSGLAERVVSKKFPLVSHAFFYWQSAERIVHDEKACRKNALRFFNNPPKINAIVQIATHVYKTGFWSVHESIRQYGPAYLTQLPYMGPATSLHLAKNLGFQEVKPDRHLTRLAAALGYARPLSMCAEIASAVGDKLSVVDLIIWRYATLNRNYIDDFVAANSERTTCPSPLSQSVISRVQTSSPTRLARCLQYVLRCLRLTRSV